MRTAAAVELEMAEGAHDVVARRPARILDPPRQHAHPHADDRLGEHIRIEAFPGLALGDGNPAPRTDALRQSLEHPRAGFGGLAARAEHDPEELLMIFGESDEGLGLGLDDPARIGTDGRRRPEPYFELARGLIGELLKELLFVLEVEIERARGVTGLRGDLMTRDAGRAVLSEERPTGFEKSQARLLRLGQARQAGHVAFGG